MKFLFYPRPLDPSLTKDLTKARSWPGRPRGRGGARWTRAGGGPPQRCRRGAAHRPPLAPSAAPSSPAEPRPKTSLGAPDSAAPAVRRHPHRPPTQSAARRATSAQQPTKLEPSQAAVPACPLLDQDPMNRIRFSRSQYQSTLDRFAKETLCFAEINPPSRSVQKYFQKGPFLFVLAPEHL